MTPAEATCIFMNGAGEPRSVASAGVTQLDVRQVAKSKIQISLIVSNVMTRQIARQFCVGFRYDSKIDATPQPFGENSALQRRVDCVPSRLIKGFLYKQFSVVAI